MADSSVRQELRTFLEENYALGEQMATLADDTSFMETGIIDSTGVLELVAFLEETYEIKVEDEELVPDNLDSVARICDFVARKTDSARTQAAG